MKIILIITVLESFVVALLLVLWRFRKMSGSLLAPINIESIAAGSEALSIHSNGRDASRWSFINGWKVAPQSDDRTPMLGDVAHSDAAPSVRRSMARRRHQSMYKQWSQTRSD